MKYYVVRLNAKPVFVVPSNAVLPAGYKTVDEYVFSIAAEEQRAADERYGVTSSWNRKFKTNVQVCEGYEPMKVVEEKEFLKIERLGEERNES